MDRQYQIHTEPVSTSPEDVTESRWHQPLSEPVRFNRNRLLAVALIASGGVIDPVALMEPGVGQTMRWFAPLSEPVRFNPAIFKRQLETAAQSSFVIGSPPVVWVDQWYIPLSEPKRFPPIALLTGAQSHVPSIVTTFAAVYTLQGASSEANFSGKGYDVTINGAASEINITIQLQDI